METESTREDVEGRLRDTAEAMSDRMASLQDELASSGTSLREWVANNPWKSVGGMLAAGVAVGVIFGGRKKKRREHAELLEKYVDALRAEMDEALAAGESPSEALERTLRGRVPLVVLERTEQEDGSSSGFLGLLGGGAVYLIRLLIREFGKDLMAAVLDGGDIEMGGLDDDGK